MDLEDLSDNTEQTETPKTRSEYLQGKTELSDVDIINILDLPVEKRSINNEIYTDKSYKELKNNPEELSSLTENLKTKPEYLKYHSSYIAKSKLMYQESRILFNEIPALMILDEINEPAYLLPYQYAKKGNEEKTFADSILKKNNAFTDFKRVFSEDFSREFKKGKIQGSEVFILLRDKKFRKSFVFRRLKGIINASSSNNKTYKVYFYAEQEKELFGYSIGKTGFITELDLGQVKKSGLTPLGKPSFAEDISNKINTPSTAENISSVYGFVNNSYFNSLLEKGAISELKRNSKIKNRTERYLISLQALEDITNNLTNGLLKSSNLSFMQEEKDSQFYKDIIRNGQRNVAPETVKNQEKTMENTSSENITYENEEMSESAAIKERNQQKKLTTQMILDQEDKEQMENISATMKSAAKDFMDLNATPITEERIDFLKTPTGNKSELSENEWKFSHSSEFKELYGDWEGKIKKDFLLNDDTVSKLTGDEFSRKEGFTLTEQVEQYFNEMNNSVESPFFGKVVLDREGADDSLSHGMGRLKAVAYAGVSNVIKNGVIIDSDLNHKDRGYNSYVIAAPIKIADKNYICEVVLKQNKQENRFYLHEVTEQKKFLERAFVTNPAQKPAHQGTLSNILEKTVSVNYEISCPMGINGEPEKTFVQNEYRKSLDEFQSKNQNTATKATDSVKQEENPSVQMEPRLMKKFDEMKKAIEDREKQEGQTAAEKTESAGSKKAESHEKTKVDLIKKAAKDFISAIKNGTAPFLNTTENDFGKILLHPAAIVNASNGLPFSGEAQLLAQIYHQQQKMEGEIVTTFEGAKESGTFIADKPESKKNFVLANKTEQQQKEIIQKTRYFMPEACSEPDKIYAHALQMQRPQKISDYRDLIRHFENIPNGQKEISDLRIRIAHEHLKEIQSRFALKEKRILTVDEINERKKILQDYFKSLPEKHRESEKSAFENTFGLTLNPEEVFKTNLEGNFKNKKFEDVVKSNEKLTDQANRRLSSFIQNNSMEDKKFSEILHEEYNEQLKEEKSTSKKLKIEAKGITEPETYLGKYLAACSSNAEFVTDEDTIKAVQANLVKKLEENYRLEKYGILKEIGQQAQKISNETTSKIAFDKAHSNKNIKEKNIAKEIGPVGMGN